MVVDPAMLERLAAIAHACCRGHAVGHDIQHVERVVALATQLAAAEGADADTVVPAAWLHELVQVPKDHPRSSDSGLLCALQARLVLVELGMAPAQVDSIGRCIEEHGYSRGVAPSTCESAVLQDADRLDAIGCTGLARCIATGALLGRALYHPTDPFCEDRTPDDATWTLDHFYRKLLRIPELLHTARGRELAVKRIGRIQGFLDGLRDELGELTLDGDAVSMGVRNDCAG